MWESEAVRDWVSKSMLQRVQKDGDKEQSSGGGLAHTWPVVQIGVPYKKSWKVATQQVPIDGKM